MYRSTFCDELYSLSFESIEEDGNNAVWFGLVQNLSYKALEKLRSMFQEHDANNENIGLNKLEFLNAISSIYGNERYSLQSNLLFDDIVGKDESTITWNDLLDFLIENLNPEENHPVILNINRIECLPHMNRETIVKIVVIEMEKYFCYVVISKYGRIGLYDGNLNFLTSYQTIMTREDISRSDDERRRRNRWVTDAIFCLDVQMMIITNSARSIMIYEASGLNHIPYWLILGIPDIIEELKFKKSHIRIEVVETNHMDTIKQIEYYVATNELMTCSKDPNKSLVKQYLSHKNPYIFKILKVLRVWDVNTNRCIQKFKLKYTSFRTEGKTIEFGTKNIYPGPKRKPLDPSEFEETTRFHEYFGITDVVERSENDDTMKVSSNKWERSNIILTCCNHVAMMKLTFDNHEIEESSEMPILTPPPLQNSVLIPASWRISDKENMHQEREIAEDISIDDHLRRLDFILDKDILVGAESSVNHKIAILETEKVQMQAHVAKGAPYLALNLSDIEELRLSDDLPVPDKKSVKKCIEKTKKLLAGASMKDQVFSESSSSRSKSSRSSITEFPY
ncbi:hypothetical protein JTB14_001555 [Gonioctena quinquepunctata]|nr:hypothetical protein JTB14_001555 [Gonioctena quinquepunctata]